MSLTFLAAPGATMRLFPLNLKQPVKVENMGKWKATERGANFSSTTNQRCKNLCCQYDKHLDDTLRTLHEQLTKGVMGAQLEIYARLLAATCQDNALSP